MRLFLLAVSLLLPAGVLARNARAQVRDTTIAHRQSLMRPLLGCWALSPMPIATPDPVAPAVIRTGTVVQLTAKSHHGAWPWAYLDLRVVRGGLPTPADDPAQRRFFGGKQGPQDLAWGYHFDTDSLFMRWFTDTGEWFYYEIRFLARDDSLRGLAYSFTDVTVPQLADSVIGHRVACKQ